MDRRLWICFWLPIILACGCTGDNSNPFAAHHNITNRPADGIAASQLPAASLAASTRVDSLGRRILAANPDISLKPLFITIGVSDLTVFHSGGTQLYVSEGLVGKCQMDGTSDPELAAVICSELGKMVAEAQQAKAAAPMNEEPPWQPRVGSGTVGSVDPTMTQQAELAKWERDHPRAPAAAPEAAAGDPKDLARCYLTRAGTSPDQLDKIAPVLRMAESNFAYEKQLGVKPSNSAGLSIP